MSILVTGAAGFLGLHVAEALLARGETVIGVDTLDSGSDPALQAARLQRLEGRPGFTFRQGEPTAGLGAGFELAAVVHLAAPAMRVCGHLDVLDRCRDLLPALRHLVYPSAAPDDLLARAYARLHRLPQTGLRLGAVYGPWGRADAPYVALADAILAGPPTDERDPHRILDLAGDSPVDLEWLVTVLEDTLGRPAARRHADWPSYPHDTLVPDLAATEAALGWRPTIAIEDGMARFAAWHRDYYGV